MNLESWKEEFEGKKILIWGYGLEGKSSYRLIRALCPGLKLDITDGGKGYEAAREQTENTGVLREEETDFSSYDMILKSPGIVPPADLNKEHMTSQTELFLKHFRERTIGITGTKGKSTTTAVTEAVLAMKYRTHLVGNIGIPCFDAVLDMEENDLAVFEISCHQLEYIRYSPHVAVYLNLYEEHLDHYGSFEAYGEAKNHIYRYQKPGDICILNEALSVQRQECPGAVLIGKDIYAEGITLFNPGRNLTVRHCRLIGAHNYSNLAVAYYIAGLYGISDAEFLEAAGNFQPLHHRIEDLGVFEQVRFVDDSISTIGQACIKAAESLPETDTVLIGGMDRGIDYTELEEYLHEHPQLFAVFMYATGKRIHREMENRGLAHANMQVCEDLAEAVECARKHTRPGHICLLSPAASSYDHFKNFEERGDIFRKLAFRL